MRRLSPAPRRPILTVFTVLVLGLALIAPLIPQQVVRADTITVTGTGDSGPGSLRQAIADAAPGDTIDFAADVTGIIVLQSQLDIDKDLTITGPGAGVLTVSGTDTTNRVFEVSANVEVTIDGLTISGRTIGGRGGAIINHGNLTITNSTISGTAVQQNGGGILSESNSVLSITNSAVSGDGSNGGGGIYMTSDSVLFVMNSIISNSSAGNGGGIYVGDRTRATIENSTISGNEALFGGGIDNSGDLSITNSTISGNSASTRGGAINTSHYATITSSTIANNSAPETSGIYIDGGNVNLASTIVANDLSSGAANCGVYEASIHSLDYNLISDDSCFEDGQEGTNDLLTTEPDLGALTDNGGPTETHAIDTTSPAYNAGGDGPCPTPLDQRGKLRPQQGACDIGAFELGDLAPSAPTLVLPTEPVVREATGPDGAAVDFSSQVSATDWTHAPLTVTCEPVSGDTFGITDTTVNCHATDRIDQTTEGSFTVRVVDTTPPSLDVPDILTVPATTPDGATVNYIVPTATDSVDGTVAVTCLPPSGSLFEIGTTIVTCTTEDSTGNEAIPVSFDITVLGAKAQIVQLIQDTRGMDIPTGPKLTIRIFLQMAGQTVDRYPAASCRFLETTVGLVASFTPRYIDRADAADILADIRRIRNVIGC